MLHPRPPQGDQGGGTWVANGRHVVPHGVAVQEFVDNQDCAPVLLTSSQNDPSHNNSTLQALLESKDLMADYGRLVACFNKEGQTKPLYESSCSFVWNPAALVSILQQLDKNSGNNIRDVFAQKGATVHLCRYTSGPYRWLWLELAADEDPTAATTPEYAITDYTVLLDRTYLVPPGVAIQVLSDLTPKKIVTQRPASVAALLQPKGLTTLYDDMVDALYQSKETRNWVDSWKTTQVVHFMTKSRGYAEQFAQHEVAVSVCKRAKDNTKWLEFVDLNAVPLPFYCSPYDVDQEKVQEMHRRQRQEQQQKHRSLSGGGQCSSNSLGRGNTTDPGLVVATEEIVTDGVLTLAEACPDDVATLLQHKGLSGDYPMMDRAITAAKSIPNFVDIWRLTALQIIQFPPVDDFRQTFAAKGVHLVLCEGMGTSERTYWLEFIDAEASPDYETPYDVAFGGLAASQAFSSHKFFNTKKSDAAKGWLTIPDKGVYVESLNHLKKLTDECPFDVRDFLNEKGLMLTYDRFIDTIVKTKSTRNWARSWKTSKIVEILQKFRAEFQSRRARLVLCQIQPDKGVSYRWFEFIDLDVAEDYVPQYDVTAIGPASLDTYLTTLQFPVGVAVEKLSDHKTLVEQMPGPVKDMMHAKNCLDIYLAMVDILCSSYDHGAKTAGWDQGHMRKVVSLLGPKFEANGVSIFLSAKKEDLGAEKGGEKIIMWMEFVDRQQQPNYKAQRGIDMKTIPRHGITSDEMVEGAIAVAATAFSITMTILESS